MKKILYNTSFLSIALSFIIILVLVTVSPGFSSLNKNIQNYYYRLKNTIEEAQLSPQIIIARIDDTSFQNIGQFPFDRSVYAKALSNIFDSGFSAIGFDLLFLDKSIQQEDTILSETLQMHNNIVLWASIDKNNILYIPENLFLKWSTDYGFLAPLVDTSNRSVYSFSPQILLPNTTKIEHFTIRLLRKYYSFLYEQDYWEIGSYLSESYYASPLWNIPLSRPNEPEILINFIKSERFPQFSFSDLLIPEKIDELNKRYDFKNKILLIGPAAEWLKDEFFTPYGKQYWIFMHANILNTLLTKQFLVYFDTRLEWLLIFCIVILSVSINFSQKSRWVLLWNTIVVVVFWIILPLSLLLTTNLVLNFFFEIIFSLLLSVALTNLVKYLIEDTNKKKLGKALSEYVSTDVMEEVLYEKGDIYLDGAKKPLGIFFSDIEHFTTLSEKLSPEEMVLFLREYFSLMTETLMAYDAYVDKFEGDAIMALWWAFNELWVEHIQTMCEVALIHQKDIKNLSKKWNTILWQDLQVRIWLHFWDAIIGNIWAIWKKMNFTALWDEVNLASRLEGVNKYYNTHICVSEDIVKQAQEMYVFCELDYIRVQGRNTPIKIFELLWKKWELSSKLLEYKQEYENALNIYRWKRFPEAKILLQALYISWYLPAKALYDRIELIDSQKLPENWDGVWNLEGK